MSGASCKTVVCLYANELSSLGYGYCLEKLMRDTIIPTPEITSAIGGLAESAPKVYDLVIQAIESPQMNARQQVIVRFVLQNIYKPVDEWTSELDEWISEQEVPETDEADDD